MNTHNPNTHNPYNTRNTLFVIKRNGTHVPIRFDEITDRVYELCEKKPRLDDSIVPCTITLQLFERVYNGISTVEIDNLITNLCINNLSHPDYATLASRTLISNFHKTIGFLKFSEVCELLHNNKDQNNQPSPIINETIYELSQKYKNELDPIIDFERDYKFDVFGFKTLQTGYLLKLYNNGQNTIIESPQHMFLRVALNIHRDNIELVKDTYDKMSNKKFIHATPTLYNSGTINNQLFSCFVLNIGDSINDIFKYMSDVAKISKLAGGIGTSISDVRARDSYIRGTQGRSDGLAPMLEVLNSIARYINQGSRRKGSFAAYIEPWHKDIFEVLELKNPKTGSAKDLFYGLWIPNNFIKAVINNEDWYLMCPSKCKGLTETYGSEFEDLYNKYILENKYSQKIKALDLWKIIIESQIQTGTPYMCYKDEINNKSNHKHLGTIKSSNLCTEIMEYNSTTEYACCCLASIVLSSFIKNNKIDYESLIDTVKTIVRNLDILIDYNYYPVPETEVSNLKTRPLGIGVQGLADVFFELGISYESTEAQKINKEIFETIYYAALSESCNLAKQKGKHPTFEGSEFSKGILQFDMWNIKPNMYDWTSLKNDIIKHGTRNSLLTALMPTASTASIMSSTESFEPMTSNIYSRKVLSGNFIVINKYLVNDLIKNNIYSKELINKIIEHKGSIQSIDEIPENIKQIYKTCWEIKQKTLMNMAADRSPFIDQSQSLNLYFANPDYNIISSAHIHGKNIGLKTNSYYIRTKNASSSESFSCNMCSA